MGVNPDTGLSILLETDGPEAEAWLEGIEPEFYLTKSEEAEMRLAPRIHPCGHPGMEEGHGKVSLCRANEHTFAHCNRCGLVLWEDTRSR